jgi:U3 small nucleolar RNA-associated protein 10
MQVYQQCIVALSESVHDDELKRLNLAILMHTRSEDPRVKIAGLDCSRMLWEESECKMNLAGKKIYLQPAFTGDAFIMSLLGYSLDTAAFIAECAEDSHDEVSKAARTLRRAVEAVGGSLESVLR